MQRRSRGLNAGLILLLSQIFQVGVNNIPPVTLATLAVNIWFFLSPLKPLLSSCLSVKTCYQERDWQRLLLSPVHHADDRHLYFNMVSMLWKGIQLERRLGSRWFAYVIATFSLLTGVVYLFLESALAEFMDEPGFKSSCAVGFSGVLFALKVLSNHYCPGGFVNVLGFPVPGRFACWAELVAIHLISPGTSFAGHLAGILVGLLYTHGPLKKLMEMCAGIFSFNTGYPRQQHYYNSGYSGYRDQHPYGREGYWEEAPRRYDAYTAGLSEEEQLERALRASLWDQVTSAERPPGTSAARCFLLRGLSEDRPRPLASASSSDTDTLTLSLPSLLATPPVPRREAAQRPVSVTGNSRSAPPSYGFRLSPEEETRRRRLHRFDHQ